MLGEQDGLITVTVPAGYAGSVQVQFVGFWFWRLADLISLLGIAGMAVFCRRGAVKAGRSALEFAVRQAFLPKNCPNQPKKQRPAPGGFWQSAYCVLPTGPL